MRKNQAAKKRPVEADAVVLDVALQVLLEAAVGEAGIEDLVLTKKEEDWVQKTLRSLTLDEKIGQMIIAEANVVFWNREGAEYRKLRHHIVDNKVTSNDHSRRTAPANPVPA